MELKGTFRPRYHPSTDVTPRCHPSNQVSGSLGTLAGGQWGRAGLETPPCIWVPGGWAGHRYSWHATVVS